MPNPPAVLDEEPPPPRFNNTDVLVAVGGPPRHWTVPCFDGEIEKDRLRGRLRVGRDGGLKNMHFARHNVTDRWKRNEINMLQ